MKLKQFIFALVAMLSFSFSAFAQTTVSTAADLKAALESTTGSEVVLGDDITLPAQITVPKKTAHILDLNGHKITGGIYVYGTLTINDNVGTGSITANSYVLNGAGGSKIILNGGRIYRGSSWSVYTTGIFVVDGGVVENTIRVAGSGSIQLNGGTVTAIQVTSGNLSITDDAVVNGNLNIEKGAKGVNIADGTINGDITIATEAAEKVTVSGGTFKDAEAVKDYLPGGSALLEKPDGTYEIVAGLLKIGETYYPTLAAALEAATDGATIELINQEGSVIAMNGSLYGKSVTITGTAKVDWSKGFLFVGRGGEGDATLTFDNANLTSDSYSASYGIHVSGREKGTADKYNGTLVIKNSAIELEYLINKGAMTLNNSSLTVKNGFDLNGRPASETENGEDANATLALTNNSKLVVNNHNGMGIGREGKGELTVDATSTFEHTQDFLVCANGTMDVKGTLVSNGKKLTNNGEVKFTDTKLTAATIEGTGTTRFYNDINFYGENSITTSGINGTPFHLVVNEGANLFITRFVLGYDRNITVNGTITDASAFNPEGQTPSLKFNSTSGVSVGGTGTGNLTVKDAYVELGSSSWKNAQGTYDWDFVNSYVSATSFTNATGADAAKWDVTFDNSVLAAKNYIKNGKNVTYNFTNNSRGTTGSLRIDGVLNIDATSSVETTSQQNNKVGAVDEHGGINGTVNVAGNLTIGSNAKTQLEVLGGTVNVKEGATLDLGNHTLTLDATSAMQSAGNISGAITAADGADVAITGGTYTQDVNKWCAEGFMTQQNADGSFGIAKAVAKVGDKKYATLEEAFKAATSGCTIEIVSDVTVDYNWDARNTGGKFTVPVTINGNGKTIKFTASVNDNNYQAPFRFEADATVKDLIVDMSEVTDNRFRAISSKGNLTVDNSKFIGKDESLNCRAIIFGEGAGANVGNLAVAITNSEFINWKRGITDNENAQDVKTVTITGNRLTDAGIGVSAKEKVTFTGNTVSGAYVNIKSYTAGNKLAVTATGNTLEANTDAAYNVIDAGGVVNAEGFNIVAKGNNFNGYTSADAIWGEVWGNARESFVIKVLDANGNVMGTTSLNNIGGIINGNVNVSWSLKFNAAANTDEYWTMEWTTAPSISNMPAKVALWVDGVEVSGGNVVLNGPDDLNKIVAAVTDADGKILSCHTSVANAAATNATNIALLRETNEEIILPAGVKLNANGFTAANVKTAVAVIGTQKFASLQAAVNAVKNGETITLVDNVAENVTLTEKVGLRYTIDGAGKTMNGKIVITPLSDENDNRRITIKGINFVNTADAAVDFISCAVTNHYPRLTVEGCTFTGNGKATDVALRLKTAYGAVIKDCTGTGLHSFLQNTAGKNLTIENVTVTNSKSAFALGTVQGVTIKGCKATVEGYGIRLDANTYNNNAVLESNTIEAFIPVVVRNANTESNITVQGTNTMNATNTDGIWFAAGTTEYETNGQMPTATTGKVLLVVNDENVNIREAYGNYVEPVAKVGDKGYGYIEDAIAAWENNTTLTLLADVALSDVITLSSQEHHYLALGTYTMTAASGKNAIEIKSYGRDNRSESGALTITADATNPGGINAGKQKCIYYKYDATLANDKYDRPIIYIKGGVFVGNSYNGINCSGHSSAQDKCATFNISGGTFNCGLNLAKAKLLISGGTFNESVSCTGGGTSLRLISGGTFKTIGFMTADSNNTKFWFGTSMGNSNVGVHVDDNGYIVVGGPVVTEAGETFEASSTNYSGASSYLQYSSAKDNGLYYTAVEEALDDNNTTSGEVTVYADEIDMTGINYKGTIIVPAGESVTITNAPADLKVKTQDGYFLENNNGTYESMRAVAKVGDKEFETVQKALQYAIDNSAAEVVVLTDVREKMVTDFDLVIKANLTIKAADKFTAEAPAKVEFYNEGTSMDFAVGTADGAERCTLTIAENVHFDLVDRVIWLGYYGNNVDVVVNGYLGGYQIWHGANTTVNNGGMLDSHGEAFIMRRNATLTANEGAKVKANYFQIYSGHINATGADITAGLVWVDGAHSYGSEGNVSFTLNNTSFVSNGEVKMTVAEGKNIPVSVTNGSAFTAKGKMTLANSVDVTVDATSSITHNNGQAFKLPVATINGLKYTSLQDAVNAVKNGETIVLVDVVEENVTLTEKAGVYYTIDGAGMTMNGTITVKALSDTEDNRRITIKNINFVADAKCDFITSTETNHYPRLTVEGCSFTGTQANDCVAIRLKSAYGAVIKNCTGKNLHSFLQNTSGVNLTIDGVTVTDSKSGLALGTVQGVTVQNCNITASEVGYGIRLDANTYNNNAVIAGNKVSAFIPVVVRELNANGNITIGEGNEFTAANTDGKWMVIGKEEYETNGALPAEVAGANVVVALNDANLSYTGIHGAGLAGKGTEAEPYLINNVAELEIFRNSVNAGSAKYSKPGLCVALNADIDMTGVNWVGIGSAAKDHGFMGNFDGKGFKIKNLTIDNPALDSDGYAYAGLFGVTEGTDKDNQNVIKNLTIENVTINTTGDIVSAAIAYPYYTIVDNVKVCGNIAITGGNYTAGVLAYTRRCVNASNLAIVGNDGSYVKGNQTVGGVISDIQMNGGLTAVYSNFSAEGVTVSGEKMVGGIAGIIATQTLNGAAVKNVTLDSKDEFAGVVAGRLGGTSTISNVVSENVTGATAVIGATYDGAKAVEARIGDTYYSTFAAAYTAAKAGETVTMLTDLNMSEILVINKAITLDGNGKTLTSTAGRAINVDCEGNVAIKNLTINASGERAINVIQKPAKVTIDNVTATAANYTVNLASSAGAAKVAISNSNLTGLNVVNVAAPGSVVTISGGTITCNDQNANENYAALTMNKDAVGAKIAATGVEFNINGDSKKASNGAVDGEITIDGSTAEVAVNVAYISYGSNSYTFTSIEDAIEFAKAGETIGLLRDVNLSEILVINKAITLDGNGKTLTSTAGRAINVSGADGVTIKNLTIDAKGERAINVIQNATNVTIEKVTATAKNYTVNVAASAPNAVVAIKNSTLNGLCTVNVSAAGANVTVDNSTVNCNDNNTTVGESYAALSLNKEAIGGSIVATNSTINVTEGSDSMKGRNGAENGTVTINGSNDGVAVMVAVIEYAGSDNYHAFATIDAAINFAKAGETIKLLSNVTVANKIVINKSVTLDGNGKTLTYTGTDRAIDVPNDANANLDVTIKNLNVVATTANRGLNYNENGKFNVEGVTVTIGENVDGYAINFPGMADGALVTIKDSKLTSRNPLNIWGENMTINVHNSEIISVDNSTTYDYAAIQLNNEIPTAGPNGAIANGTVVNVYGGIITALNDNGEPSNVVANATETAVVNISDETVITGKVLNYVANIGGAYFGSLQAAVNAIEKHGYNSPIVIMKNFATSEATTIKSGLKVTINLNGKTITGTDNGTASYGLININPGAELTINDATGNGAIKLTATNNREWNAYSSVISNQRGKLTVNGGTIEHLGGTDMAYAIDNLTNGKGTKAETIINGGVIKSTYRAVRQFLNGTEAQNILTVNGGTIEGANKSIWMQDPSANANTGSLSVDADAKLNGDVYLFVTAGSTEWPVSVSIAADALQGESKVVTGNVPAGYDVAEVNGAYGVYTGVAKIGTAYYETLKAAVEAAQAGETITLIDNVEASEVILLGKSLTINGNGYKVTSNATRVFRVTTSDTKVTLNDVNMVSRTVMVYPNDIRGISIDAGLQNVELTLNNCSVDFTDATACDWAYAVNVSGNGTGHTVTVNGGTYEGANVINVHGANNTVTVKDATLTSLYPNNDTYYGACIWVLQNQNTSVEATGNTFNGDNAYAFNLGNGNPLTESDNIDNTKYVVAKIGDAYYTSIQDAIEAAQDGETVRLIQNVKMDTKTLATQNDGYAVLVNVNGKKVAIDLNGKKITVNAAAADLAAAKGKMLLAVFSADLGGHLTLTDNSDAKNGAVTLNVNDAKVYSMFVSESKESDKSNSGKLTVNGGNYTTVGNVSNAMFFTDANEVITVNGGNFHCDGATTTTSYPWMFNTNGNNELHVTVNGGTFNVDVNHQHRPFEVKVPETLAVKANGDGTWTVVPAEAYITEMLGGTVYEAGEWGHKVGYATIAEAIAAVNELGNKVSIAKNLELTEAVVVPADKTVVLDLNGKTVTMNDASGAAAALLKNNGNLTIMDGTEAKAGKLSFKTTTPSAANAYASNTISNYGILTIESGNVENLSVGGGACYALDNYAGSTATINGGKLTAEKTAVRIFNWTNGEEAKATINMNGGEIYSKNGYGINVNSGNAPFVALNIAGGTITTDYADYKLAVYVVNKGTAENFTANVTGGTFNGIFALNGVTAQTMKQGAVAVSGGTFEGVTCYDDPAYGFVSGGTFKSAVDAKAVATGYICKDNGNGTFGVVVDPKYGKVAQIIRNDYYADNQYFATINEAVQAAVTGETVTLIADVETSAAGYATIGKEGYAVLVAVKEKDIILDLNGKSVTVTPTVEELANAEGKMLMSVFGMDTNGKLTLTGNGSVKVNAKANGANVYSLVAAYGEGSAVVIENGNYEADAVNASGSLIYSHEMITVMGGTFNLGNIATGANGSPWIFNTIGQNYTGVKVVGGTYPTDINHQFWANEVLVPEAYALQNNGDGTWTVVPSVAYTNEKATSRNASWRHVGYASLEDAIAATGKYNCQENVVTLYKDFAMEPITVANGVEVAIDLNGKTISGTDSGTASYGLITNKGDLTINGTGAITLTATQNRGWSAYSSVISNQVGGKLTVNGGTIQHLGGTSMAYAIDNLTNGKGTYAETIINGGEIKSTYRPIRMFLNGVEAQNILTVNAGTIEGTGGNKAAIWMQTAGDVAHSGTLYVGEGAVIKNNVYLDADNLKNVREYPVEAYIAKAALAENMTVLADNIPAEAAALVEYDTFWQVEQKNLAALTIEDDCEEYINKIEKNVKVLTYERYFDDTKWQTIVLPFDVPVANLMDEFEVAYIYNASYKGKQATIDYVVIEDSEFVLAANYPYMIKAKEAGWNNIVVENAKLMPTEVEILDCSSIFEKFSFIGNYATVDAPSNDGMGYFNLTSGAWSKMETINPFRFYMQIKLRNGGAFEYPSDPQAIRMRSVNANGEETTGINGVDAEQAGDFIFDLHGRRVLEPEKGGIYIKNGQKFIAQ